MRLRPSAACAALALGALLPATSAAQSTDAFVLPFGMFRLGVQGAHASFDSRYDASGNPVRVGEELSGDLVPERFAAIQPLATHVANFLAATADAPGADPSADAASITLGQLDVVAAGSRSEARATISIGVLPRVEIGASMPIGRGERLLQRFGLAEGNLGLNPDPTGNAELLGRLGWAPLGTETLLPTADSPLGTELQSRITALTGESLNLPTQPADADALQSILQEAYGLPPISSGVDRWRLGDLEVEARGLLLSTFGDAPVPMEPTGLQLRVALHAGARIPTGEASDSIHLLGAEPAEGLSAIHAGGVGDLFVGSRFWITGALRLTLNQERESLRRVAPAGAPLSAAEPPTLVTVSPGNSLEFRLAPRFRLAEAIALGGEYAYTGVSDTRFTAGADGAEVGILDLAGGSLHRVGLGIRYSSLPAYWAGQAAVPAEVTLGYHRTIAGPEGSINGGIVTVTASVLPRIW